MASCRAERVNDESEKVEYVFFSVFLSRMCLKFQKIAIFHLWTKAMPSLNDEPENILNVLFFLYFFWE